MLEFCLRTLSFIKEHSDCAFYDSYSYTTLLCMFFVKTVLKQSTHV